MTSASLTFPLGRDRSGKERAYTVARGGTAPTSAALPAGVALLVLLTILMLLAGLAVPGTAVAKPFPDVIPLPDGFQPEGIAIGRGPSFYVGSLADGAIFAGDLRTGEGEVLVQGQPGGIAVGLDVDVRTNHLFVSGGPTGTASVYDANTGDLVSTFPLTSAASFINDVVVTRQAAYFTDSFQPQLYRLPLGPGGRVDPDAAVETIPLTGDYVFVPGEFNANGIVASADSRWLIIVNSTTGTLYRVDPVTGVAESIDLGGDTVPAGDGLLLQGRTLYVVQNNLNQISVVELSPDLLSGEIVRVITDPGFRVPTTVAAFGNSLYAVNARFGVEPMPTTEYEVVRVTVP